MRNGIPSIYWTFRYAWSVVHVALLVTLSVLLAVYLIQDGRGEQWFTDFYRWADEIRASMSSLIPFPWD